MIERANSVPSRRKRWSTVPLAVTRTVVAGRSSSLPVSCRVVPVAPSSKSGARPRGVRHVRAQLLPGRRRHLRRPVDPVDSPRAAGRPGRRAPPRCNRRSWCPGSSRSRARSAPFSFHPPRSWKVASRCSNPSSPVLEAEVVVQPGAVRPEEDGEILQQRAALAVEREPVEQRARSPRCSGAGSRTPPGRRIPGPVRAADS